MPRVITESLGARLGYMFLIWVCLQLRVFSNVCSTLTDFVNFYSTKRPEHLANSPIYYSVTLSPGGNFFKTHKFYCKPNYKDFRFYKTSLFSKKESTLKSSNFYFVSTSFGFVI